MSTPDRDLDDESPFGHFEDVDGLVYREPTSAPELRADPTVASTDHVEQLPPPEPPRRVTFGPWQPQTATQPEEFSARPPRTLSPAARALLGLAAISVPMGLMAAAIWAVVQLLNG
jgi:hypothetical protein